MACATSLTMLAVSCMRNTSSLGPLAQPTMVDVLGRATDQLMLFHLAIFNMEVLWHEFCEIDILFYLAIIVFLCHVSNQVDSRLAGVMAWVIHVYVQPRFMWQVLEFSTSDRT